MSRKTFDSSEYYRARANFDGYCLGCGTKIGFTKRLILAEPPRFEFQGRD